MSGDEIINNSSDENEFQKAKSAKVDPYDLSKLKLSQNFGERLGVKKSIVTIPVRKPSKQEFVRANAREDMRMMAAVVELKDGGSEIYVVTPQIAEELPGEVTTRFLVSAITRQGTFFIWPAKMPISGGRKDHWSESALEAIEIATRKWVRVSANMQLGAYEIYEATGISAEPEWPDLDLQQAIKIAFKGRLIDSMDHPVVRQLLGRE